MQAPVYFVFLLSRLREDAFAYVCLQDIGKGSERARVYSATRPIDARHLDLSPIPDEFGPHPPGSAAVCSGGLLQSAASFRNAVFLSGHFSKVFFVWVALVLKIGALVGLVALAVVLPFAVTGMDSPSQESVLRSRGLPRTSWSLDGEEVGGG